MSETGFDLDRSVEEAWRGFRARLADHLAQMGEDDVLVVEALVDSEGDEVASGEGDEVASGEGATPYVQFLRWVGEDTVRGEVSSNTYLAEAFALDEGDEAALTAMGWQPPTGSPEPGNFVADVPVREADRLAVMSVRVLREVFGVVHPVFLDADGLEVDPQDPQSGERHGGAAVERDADEPLAVVPQSADHLRDLVSAALVPLLGREPVPDEDGDIPVFGSHSLVYVRVDEQAPVVQLFSFLVRDVTDLRRARREVNVLNREFRFIKFALVHDRVMARIFLPSWPFVPEHLRSMVAGMSEALDELEDDAVERLGGRRMGGAEGADVLDDAAGDPDVVDDAAGDPDVADDAAGDPDEQGMATGHDQPARESDDDVALQTLLQLDAGGGGTLDPELVAGLCGHDQRRVLRLLRISEQQEIAWREARDTAREAEQAGEARACAHELRAWRGTSELLRQVLWLVVRRSVGHDPATGREPATDEAPPTRGSSGSSGTSSDRSPRASKSARPARRREATRPRAQRQVRDASDLARHFGTDRLGTVARALAVRSTLPVQVVDRESYLEVAVAGTAAMLAYPFSLGELYALVASLEVAAGAGHEQQARQGD